MRKILVPFDGSDSAMRAVNYAVNTVKYLPKNEFEVHLLHVCEPLNLTTEADYWRPEVQSAHLLKGEKTLSRAKEAVEATGITPYCRVHMGYPHHDIPSHVRKHGCTEVVMGSRGLSPAASFFIGSVASRVLQHVNCPVTLVK